MASAHVVEIFNVVGQRHAEFNYGGSGFTVEKFGLHSSPEGFDHRKKWKTRIELANAIFEFIEVFYNRQRRHSKIGYISPVEFEVNLQQQPA